MRISLDGDQIEYDDFLKNNLCTFYQSKKHLRFLEKLLKIKTEFIIATEKKKMIGVIPFFRKKTKFGIVINSLPFFGSYGGVISENIEAKKNIINFLNEYNKENDILSSVIVANPFDSAEIYEKYYEYKEKEQKRIQCLRVNKISEDRLWNNFEQRVRRSIRKAEKNLVSVECSTLDNKQLDDFYKTHVENISSKNGATKPREFFKILKESFVVGEDYDVLTAIYDSESIAYLLVFYFKSFTEYYMPAYNVEKSNLQGTSLLIWESIKKSLTNNMKYYNFGGTNMGQKSLYNFKKGWGTDDFNYNYYVYGDFNKINELGENLLKENFKNFYVYNYEKLSN